MNRAARLWHFLTLGCPLWHGPTRIEAAGSTGWLVRCERCSQVVREIPWTDEERARQARLAEAVGRARAEAAAERKQEDTIFEVAVRDLSANMAAALGSAFDQAFEGLFTKRR